MDRRARDYARNGQRLLASDLIFSDGIEKIDAALTALDRARTSEKSRAATSTLQQQRAVQLIGGSPARPPARSADVALLIPLPAGGGSAAGGRRARLRSTAAMSRLRRARPRARTHAGQGNRSARIAPEPAEAAASARRTVDLTAGSPLCSRARAGSSITPACPAALEQAAKLLRRVGDRVWVADPDGRELTPVIASRLSAESGRRAWAPSPAMPRT